MTTAHPRDPRLRRQPGGPFHPVDASAAAVRLEVAADAMRAALTGPEPEDDAADEVTILTADLATAVQLGTVEPPLTAQQFADALDGHLPGCYASTDPDPSAPMCEDCTDQRNAPPLSHAVAESPAPAPVAPMPPVDGAPASASSWPESWATGAGRVDVRQAFSSERSLTWRPRHDVRSLAYGIRPTLAGSAPLTDHLWPVGPVLDQGAEGQCVGCAVVDAWNALHPADAAGPLFLEDAGELYHRAQQLDEVPGESYSGTSVLAGMKAGVEAGLFGGYRWAFGTRDVAQAVLQVGPVVVGVPWLSGMYDTGPGGLVTLAGDDQGLGHCLAVVGIRVKGPQWQPGPFFVWQNSWGPSYGDGGLGYIHHRDLAELLHGTGEAAIPLPGPQHV